jgi:hypothetical protein
VESLPPAATGIGCVAFVGVCVFLCHWKSVGGIPIHAWSKTNEWFPVCIADAANPASLLGTIKPSMQAPSLHHSLTACLCAVSFGGIDRKTGQTLGVDRLAASPVSLVEMTVGASDA